MKKLGWLIIPLLIGVLSGFVHAESADTIHRSKLIIAGDRNYPPFEFISEVDGSYRGLNIDVMHAIEAETNVEIELVPMEWSEAKKALNEGRVDAIEGMARTDNREFYYDFSEAYHINTQVIFVPSASHDISSIQDLKGRTVALQKGDVNEEIMGKMVGVKVIFYPDQHSALEALLSGKADAVLGNKAVGIYQLQHMKHINDVKIVGDTLAINEYGIAVRNGDKSTLLIVNQGIRALKEKGTLKRIEYKWFGESIEDQTKWRPLLVMAVIVSTGLSILLLLIFLINKKLQSEVSLRTREILKMREQAEMKDMQKWHIINNISSAIMVFDASGYLILFNQMSKELIDSEMALEQHWCQIEFCRQLGIEVFDAVLEKEQEEDGNIMMLTAEGQTKYIHYALTPVPYKDKSECELILMVKDNTQEKMLLDVVHQNDKLSAIGKVSASIAHELRNPLNAMKMYVDLMPNRLDNTNFMMQALKVLPSEIKRLNGIIDGLLDYTKFTESRRECVKLTDIADDISTLLKVNFVHKRVNFEKEIKAEAIYADGKQIKQVLLNLMLNAVASFGENGGKIQMNAWESEGKVTIVIKDNGSGISKHHLDRVFEPNFTTKSDGYGIGLAISKQLIEENKGSIWIESVVNEGTQVFIELEPFHPEKI